MHTALKFQRMSFAACIILAPLSISLYLVTWAGNLRQPVVSGVGDQEVVEAEVVGIVEHYVAGLRFLVHGSQKRLERGVFVVAQSTRRTGGL